MPYIEKKLRPTLEPRSTVRPLSAGELNFQITRLCWKYIEREGLSYATLNTVTGALECVKLELYRRLAAPYEDRKLDDNGDVYQKEPV